MRKATVQQTRPHQAQEACWFKRTERTVVPQGHRCFSWLLFCTFLLFATSFHQKPFHHLLVQRSFSVLRLLSAGPWKRWNKITAVVEWAGQDHSVIICLWKNLPTLPNFCMLTLDRKMLRRHSSEVLPLRYGICCNKSVYRNGIQEEPNYPFSFLLFFFLSFEGEVVRNPQRAGRWVGC